MKITIRLENCDKIASNIEAQQRAIDNKSFANDFILLNDTKSILTGIQKSLEEDNGLPTQEELDKMIGDPSQYTEEEKEILFGTGKPQKLGIIKLNISKDKKG